MSSRRRRISILLVLAVTATTIGIFAYRSRDQCRRGDYVGVVFLSDDESIAALMNGTLIRYDSQGKVKSEYSTGLENISRLSLSDSGRFLLVEEDRSSTASRGLVLDAQDPNRRIGNFTLGLRGRARISPDDRTIAISGNDANLFITSLVAKEAHSKEPAPINLYECTCLSFSPSGTLLAVVAATKPGFPHSLKVLKIRDGKMESVSTISIPHAGAVHDLIFIDESNLLVGMWEFSCLVNLDTAQNQVVLFPKDERVPRFQKANGRIYVTGAHYGYSGFADRSLYRLDPTTGRLDEVVLPKRARRFITITPSTDVACFVDEDFCLAFAAIN